MVAAILVIGSFASTEATVPSVVMMRLDKAEQKLSAANVSKTATFDVLDHGPVMDSGNWIVIEQEPSPGTVIDRHEDTVRLTIVNENDEDLPTARPSIEETPETLEEWFRTLLEARTLSGTVNMTGDEEIGRLNTIEVTGSPGAWTVRFQVSLGGYFTRDTVVRELGPAMYALLRSPFGVESVEGGSWGVLVDSYGAENITQIYGAVLDQSTVNRIDAANLGTVDWEAIWKTTFVEAFRT